MRELSADTGMQNGVLERTQLAKLLRQAAGLTARDWVMLDAAEREAAHDRGAARLCEAAGVGETEFDRMLPFSTARSAALLRGAEVLGIETEWAGWE